MYIFFIFRAKYAFYEVTRGPQERESQIQRQDFVPSSSFFVPRNQDFFLRSTTMLHFVCTTPRSLPSFLTYRFTFLVASLFCPFVDTIVPRRSRNYVPLCAGNIWGFTFLQLSKTISVKQLLKGFVPNDSLPSFTIFTTNLPIGLRVRVHRGESKVKIFFHGTRSSFILRPSRAIFVRKVCSDRFWRSLDPTACRITHERR